MDLPKPKPSKRLDLQGIRALAIIVVLGFHFFPEYCPNGYLGVDQFFVLSGFLMCMLLKRAENQSACSLITLFYSKRFKRILPLYLLIILISMICLYYFFPDTAIETNQDSAIHALLFVSNRPKTDQENYFQMLSLAVDIFTHTWSLSVEIQFYFLVPFIFIIGKWIPDKFQYGYYGTVGLFSFIFSWRSPATVAFNSVFARIWQFSIGMMVNFLFTPQTSNSKPKHLILPMEAEKDDCEQQLLMNDTELVEKRNESESEEISEIDRNEKPTIFQKYSKPTSYTLLIFVVYILTYPIPLKATVVRPIVTIGTGFLMLVSPNNPILSHKIFTYIGDISYSLYLIHWPIYAYWKLTCNGDKYLLVLALASSIVLAVITYEIFEKWYLKLSSTSVGALVVLLFFLNEVVINKDSISDHIGSIGRNFTRLDGVTENMTIDDAIRLNSRWSVNDMKNLYSSTCVYEKRASPLGWCRHTGLKRNGKYKLVIIGNSWTANHAKMLYQECGYRAKSIMQGAAYGCEPLYPSDHSKMCEANFTDFEERIRKEKPDYAFIITRYISIGQPFPNNVTNFDKDPIYQIMKTQMLKIISNIKYKLYILDAIPRTIASAIGKIGSLLKNNTDPVKIDKLFVDFTGYEMARKRHAQLAKDCGGKCILVDYVPEFYNNSTRTFRFFDEKGFSYATTPMHLSPHGIEHVRHVWTDICRKL